MKLKEIKQLIQDFLVEGKNDDPTTKELARQALDGDDGARIVLADKMDSDRRQSFATILNGDDDDRIKEVLSFLAGEDEGEFESPKGSKDWSTNPFFKMFTAILSGDVVQISELPAIAQRYFPGQQSVRLSMQDALILVQRIDNQVPTFVVDYVLRSNDDDFLYIIARSNVTSEDAKRFATTESGLHGLTDNRRYIREYFEQYLKTTLDPNDWNSVTTCAMYAAPDIVSDIVEMAMATGNQDIITAVADLGPNGAPLLPDPNQT